MGHNVVATWICAPWIAILRLQTKAFVLLFSVLFFFFSISQHMLKASFSQKFYSCLLS